MTSSNAIAESALVVDAPAEQTSETDNSSTTPAPFEFLPAGEAFGVCDLDGECR